MLLKKQEWENLFFQEKTVIADTGSFSKENLKYLNEKNIDAYIPD